MGSILAFISKESLSKEGPVHVGVCSRSGSHMSPNAEFFDDVPAQLLHHLATKGSRVAMAEPVKAEGVKINVKYY